MISICEDGPAPEDGPAKETDQPKEMDQINLQQRPHYSLVSVAGQDQTPGERTEQPKETDQPKMMDQITLHANKKRPWMTWSDL
nr:hypothetical protein BaRGS_034316 [Batillaria attramentaria]